MGKRPHRDRDKRSNRQTDFSVLLRTLQKDSLASYDTSSSQAEVTRRSRQKNSLPSLWLGRLVLTNALAELAGEAQQAFDNLTSYSFSILGAHSIVYANTWLLGDLRSPLVSLPPDKFIEQFEKLKKLSGFDQEQVLGRLTLSLTGEIRRLRIVGGNHFKSNLWLLRIVARDIPSDFYPEGSVLAGEKGMVRRHLAGFPATLSPAINDSDDTRKEAVWPISIAMADFQQLGAATSFLEGSLSDTLEIDFDSLNVHRTEQTLIDVSTGQHHSQNEMFRF